MFLKEERSAPPDRQGAMPELLEDYKAQRMHLVAQQRELERLRRQVRASAEREAAAIVTAARRDVRQVLVDARRELLVLVAQLQAVGCDTEAGDLSAHALESSATTASIGPASGASGAQDEPFGASEIVTGARRDVREVLLEAQSELVALAEEARELRARISGRQEIIAEAGPVLPAFPEETQPVFQPIAAVETEAIEAVPATIEHQPLGAPSRMWIGIAAAGAFAVIGLTVFLTSRGGSQPTAAPQAQSRTADSKQNAASRPAAGAVTPAANDSARSAAPVSLALQLRRPVWIRATVDGRADIGRTFAAGESRTLTATREIVLRAGDAGAVLVSLNGAGASPLGSDGQVITRRFGVPAQPAARQPAVIQAAAGAPAPAPAALKAEQPPADVGTAGVSEAPPPQVPAVAPGAAERDILRETQRWFEAYFGGDAEGMGKVATPDFSLVDERADGQRLPVTMRGVERGLQQVRIEVAGDGAVISARMTERANVDGRVREYVSLVSGVWIRTDGRWRLTSVRFVNPANIGPLN